MSTSTYIVDFLATTTGQIMTDSYPLLIYIFGIIMTMGGITLFWKALKQIKKIFK